MKKPIRTHDPGVPASSPSSAPAPVNALWRAAELFACLLTVLLPVKFASIVSVPEGGALYWSDPVSLLVIAWPLPVFMVAASLLLGLTILAAAVRKDMALYAPLLKYGALWGILGCVSILGLTNASCMGYPPQMIAHALSLASYALSLSILLSGRRDFAGMLTGSLVLGGVLSLASGMYQYWCGFDALREHVKNQAEATGRGIVSDNMAIRIAEARVQADFISCNVYGAYLAGLLPFLTVLFWRFGNERVTPPKLSRRLFGGLIFAATVFLLVKTDSRGAVFSLLAAGALVFFLSGLPRKWKFAGAGLLLAGAAGLAAMIAYGRGALSMYVRFDYVQSAGRMMLEHPLTGTGWGDFLHDHSLFRLWRDKETAHSPHNMIMLFGSQCGIAGLLAAFAVLGYPVVEACRQARRTDWRNPKDFFALVPGLSCLILSVGTLVDIGFETTAYSGVLIAFSMLVLMRDASADPVVALKSRRHWAAAALLTIFAAATLMTSGQVFRAEKNYSTLLHELNPEYSFEHMDDPDYVPPPALMKTLFLDAVRAAPGSPFPWNTYADYMFMTGRGKEALTCVNRVIELDPLQSAHYTRSARLKYWLAGMNVTDDVRRDLETARRLAPKNPELNRPDADICREAFNPKESQR